MKTKIASRVVLSTLLALAALPIYAQTPDSTAPIVTFQLANNSTLHQHDGAVPVTVMFSDGVGLKKSVIAQGNRRTIAHYVNSPKTAYATFWFFTTYLPVGDYTFHAAVMNIRGVKAAHLITVHIVP